MVAMLVDDVAIAMAGLRQAMAALLAVDLTRLDSDELLEGLRRFEGFRRSMSTVDHRLVAEVESRGLAHERNVADTRKFLSQLLRISPGEATSRVMASERLGRRCALTGDTLPALFPVVAASQAAGSISPAHAQVITKTIDALPAAAAEQFGPLVERTLVEQALHCHPDALRSAARRIVDRLDPDGTLSDEHDQERLRGITLTRNRDGSGTLSGRLTPACTERWLSVLDPLAAPIPADVHGAKDTRTGSQRIHDAFDDVARRVLRSGALADCGGTPATVLITVTADQLGARRTTRVGTRQGPPGEGGSDPGQPGGGGSDVGPPGAVGFAPGTPGEGGFDPVPAELPGFGDGLATTGHGALIGVDAALRIADEAHVVTVVQNRAGRVLSHETRSRIATRNQRLALAARDGGCSFPQCDAPSAWTQAHHVTEWSRGGATNLDNLTLLCGYHHRNFERAGWSCRMVGGVPYWSPPAFIDPARMPRRNTAHNTAAVPG